EIVLDFAKAQGFREGENPAHWRGHLDKLLPAPSKVRKVTHLAALPYTEIAKFLTALRTREGVAARALEFAILTAARTNEVLGTRWSEVCDNVWTVPETRMKARREHRVPLAPAALRVLNHVQPQRREDDFVFPGPKGGRPLSNMALLSVLRRMRSGDLTTHGFRATFKTWASEQTRFPREVIEAALAHAVGDKVEAAYQRGDLFEKRQKLMNAWSEFCAKESATAELVLLQARK